MSTYIAKDNKKRVELAPWPESVQDEDAVTQIMSSKPPDISSEKQSSGKDEI
jgi:hypothetical protein